MLLQLVLLVPKRNQFKVTPAVQSHLIISANIAFNNATEASKLRVDELQQISTILAPAMFDMNARNQLNLSVKAVEAALLA